MSANSYSDYYNLAMYLNTSNRDNSYMSFKDGVLLNGAIGAGIEFARYGGGKLISVFNKNKPSKLEQLRKQIELKNAVRGKNKYEVLKNAWRYNNIKDYSSKLPTAKVLSPAELAKLSAADKLKYQKQLFKAQYFDRARTLLDEAKKLKGSAQAAKLKEFKQAFAEAKLAAYKAKFTGNLKPTTLLGKAGNVVKTVSGVRVVNTAAKTLSASSKVLRTAGKFVKGNAAFAVLSVAADYDKFIAAKKAGGNKVMAKEIAKSTGVAAVEAVGFMAGMKAGAAIGTAVGSVVPGIGNLVGGIAGAVIGGLASWGLGKVAHKAFGCDVSEADKIGTKKAKLAALRAKFNQKSREQLVKESAIAITEGAQKVQEAEANGQTPNQIEKERLQNAAQSLQNIAEDDPQLIENMMKELETMEKSVEDPQSENPEMRQSTQSEQNPQGAVTGETTAQDTTALQATMQKFVERVEGKQQAPAYQFPQFQWGINGMY